MDESTDDAPAKPDVAKCALDAFASHHHFLVSYLGQGADTWDMTTIVVDSHDNFYRLFLGGVIGNGTMYSLSVELCTPRVAGAGAQRHVDCVPIVPRGTNP